jgi:hypothetical protein
MLTYELIIHFYDNTSHIITRVHFISTLIADPAILCLAKFITEHPVGFSDFREIDLMSAHDTRDILLSRELYGNR